MVESRRIGRFSISQAFINFSSDSIKLIMGQMIIIRAEAMFHDSSIAYMAISDLFDEIAEGSVIPEYAIIVDGKNITAKRKK